MALYIIDEGRVKHKNNFAFAFYLIIKRTSVSVVHTSRSLNVAKIRIVHATCASHSPL